MSALESRWSPWSAFRLVLKSCVRKARWKQQHVVIEAAAFAGKHLLGTGVLNKSGASEHLAVFLRLPAFFQVKTSLLGTAAGQVSTFRRNTAIKCCSKPSVCHVPVVPSSDHSGASQPSLVCVCVCVCFLPGGNGNLGQTSQRGCLGQTDEGHEGLAEEIHLAHQHVGRLGVSGNLLHELVLQLQEAEGRETNIPIGHLTSQTVLVTFNLWWFPVNVSTSHVSELKRRNVSLSSGQTDIDQHQYAVPSKLKVRFCGCLCEFYFERRCILPVCC